MTERSAELSQQENPLKESLPQEIERKFLVRNLTDRLDQYSHQNVTQGYLAISPDGTEVRLRRMGDEYTLTVKVGRGKTRSETKITVAPDQFGVLWPVTKGKRIDKTRYLIPYQQHTVEVDVYHKKLEGLVTAEVEFSSDEDSLNFEKLDWFDEEVTDDKRYKNQNLALHGLPGDLERERS